MAQTESEFDFLHFTKEQSNLNIPKDEQILFSDALKKKSPAYFKGWQNRNIVITDKAIYNFDKMKKKRKFEFKDIKGITVSKITDEFVLHGDNEDYDYQFQSTRKKKIVEIISQNYYNQMDRELKLFEINTKTLDSFVTTKAEKQKDVNKSKMPITGQIPVSEYIYGTNTKTHLKSKQGAVTKTSKIVSQEKVTLDDFDLLKTIGRGSTGKIILVKYKKTGDLYVIKNIRKDKLVSEDIADYVNQEKQILSVGECPFLLTLSFFFQSPERIYFVTPYIPGGDLYQKLKLNGTLDENYVKLYSAQVAIALEHLHNFNIAYRDLKPENILINEDGYIILCDFGSAIHLKGNEKEYSFAGIDEYASPEMISGAGHNTSTDWWSFGILLYELLFGFTPFNHYKKENDEEERKKIEEEEEEVEEDNNQQKEEKERKLRNKALIRFSEVQFPQQPKVSKEAMNIIMKLLNKNPNERLGAKKGLQEIQKDPFYGANIDFESLKNKKLNVSKIKIDNPEDASNFDPVFLEESVTDSPVSEWVTNYQDWFTELSKEES